MSDSSSAAPFTWLVALSFLVVLLGGVLAQDCEIIGLSKDDLAYYYTNPETIDGQYVGLIKEFSMVKTLKISSTSISNNMNTKFIDATFDSTTNTTTIVATTEMQSYEQSQTAPEITLSIDLVCANGFKTFLFRQNIEPKNNHDPVFQQSEYKILVPLPLPRGFVLNFLPEISARDIDIHNNRVTFSSLNDLSLFAVGTSPTIGSDSKTFYATVQTTNQLLRLPEPFVFTIIGTDSGEPMRRTGNATVIIEADANIEYVEVPRFEQPFYRGSLNSDLILNVPQPVLSLETYSGDIEFKLIDGDSVLFTLTNASNVISVTLARNLTASDIKNRSILLTTLVANVTNVGQDSTIIIVDVNAGSDVPTQIDAPAFDKNIYIGALDIDRKLILEELTIVLDTFDSSVQIEIEEDNAGLFIASKNYNKVTISLSRVLTDTDVAGKTILSATVRAVRQNIGSNIAAVVVEIVNLPDDCPVDCPSGACGVNVKDALLVKYLVENEVHDVTSSVIGDCAFQVVEWIPTIEGFVNINTETKNITTIAMDRESPVFDDMEVPQVQITLQLQCGSSQATSQDRSLLNQHKTHEISNGRSIAPQSPDNRFYVLTDSIPFSNYTTILTIIIEDENDNVPQFVQPLRDNHLIGYPEPLLAARIMPPHLYHIQATDRDSGINAQIHYSMADSSEFQINSETGVITPGRIALQNGDEIVLTISATDRNGAADGLNQTTHLRVKRLEERHISVITIQGEDLAEIANILAVIYEEVALELKVLHSAIIPLGPETTARASGPIKALRIFAYAFESIDNLMVAAVIQKQLENFDSSAFKMVAQTYESLYSGSDSTNLTGLIVGCCILFALLLLSILGTFLLWWFKVRPYNYVQMDETTSVSSQRNLDNISASFPPSTPAMKAEHFEVDKREPMDIQDSTIDSSDDSKSVHTLVASLNACMEPVDISEWSSPPSGVEPSDQSRKTNGVRFNEQVERIDILVDAEAEQSIDEIDERPETIQTKPNV